MLIAFLPRFNRFGNDGLGSLGDAPRLRTTAALSVGILLLAAIHLWWIPTLPERASIVRFGEIHGLIALPSAELYYWSAAGGLLVLMLAPLGAQRLNPRLLWWLALGYTLVLTLPGLFEPIALDTTPPGSLQGVEWHFDAVFGGVYTPAAGAEGRHVGYSFLLSLIRALVERHFGVLSFATDIRIVQAGNLAFALCTYWACRLWNRDQPLIALTTLALVLPWVHNNHQNVFFPNQSGLRFVAFPAAVMVLRASHHLPIERASWLLGIFGVLALLWNVETGLAVVAGLMVYLAVRINELSPRTLALVAGGFSGGMAVGLCGFFLIEWVGLGVWPQGSPIFLRMAKTAATDFSYGWPLYFDPLAILILGYGIWNVFALAMERRAGPPSDRVMDRGSLAAIALVWGAYYVIRPHPWNTWSYLLFLGLLLGDSLFSVVRQEQRKFDAGILVRVPVFAAVLVVIPALIASNLQAAGSLLRGLRLAGPDAARSTEVLSGVRVQRSDALAIGSRLAFLKTVPDHSRAFTADSFLLSRLSARADLFLQQDPAYTALTLKQFDALISDIRANAPPLLLFDDPATLPRGDLHARYFEHMQAALLGLYQFEGITSGWSVWRKRN
jgi:hypothetical protein